ncbi:MAG TPA: class I SAM-dependent methyltransferase [Chloroflexota bacterium]|nr:class I SAM-dependent methyltransferase [Chloroflexota bacterium]
MGFAGPDYRDFVTSGGERLRPRLARSLDLAKIRPGVRLLDLGCGRGEVAVHAARRGAEVIAADYSPDCARLTEEAVRMVGWVTPEAARVGSAGSVRVLLADATALPFPPGSFDRVTLLDVVEHLVPWQLDGAMREVRRILKPSGYAVIHTVPNRWALGIGYPLLRLIRPGLPRDPRTDYEHQVHVNEQDIVGLRRTLERAGLASRVWLENLTLEQARWQQNSDQFADLRGASYGFFRTPAVRALARLALRTPLRLVACNDIYALAWPK